MVDKDGSLSVTKQRALLDMPRSAFYRTPDPYQEIIWRSYP
jgi:hypothetical protein